VVHPHHGPGRISGIEHQELLDGIKRYYVIEIPRSGLTLHVPEGKASDGSMRPAMSQSRFLRVLSILPGRTHRLPENYKERQERIGAQLKTRRVTQLVRVVRDLTWRQQRARLTKTDADYLRQGRELLAAEMALVSGQTIADVSKLIDAALAAGVVV